MKLSDSDWIQIVLAVITLIGIDLALYSNNQQIKMSNKQTLFEKRLDVFVLAEGFKRLIKENKNILEIPEKFEDTNGLKFRSMINNTYLTELWKVIPEPLNRNGNSPIDNPEAQQKFLIKKEEMIKSSQTAELIFEEPENRVISNFINGYITLLDGRRQYEIVLKEYWKNEEQYSQRNNNELGTEEYLEKHTNEKEVRQNLLVERIENLSISYASYCKQQVKIKEQISLKKGRKKWNSKIFNKM